MSASKIKKRYWLSLFFKDLAVGETFKPSLAHLTIIPWFVVSLPEPELIESFNSSFAGWQSFNLNISQKINFGPRGNVPVSLIKYSAKLEELHQKSLKWLQQINGRWAIKNPYVDEQYRAHIRRRAGTHLSEGQQFRIDSLILVKANRQEDNVRMAAAKVNFND